MADYGIKVTKDGYDVSTATLLQQTFNSQKNSLKIALEGSASSNANGGRDITVAHGLSVVPGYYCFYQVDSSGKWYPNFTIEDDSGKNVNIQPYTDGTNLVIPIWSDSTANVKVYYFVFVDPGL